MIVNRQIIDVRVRNEQLNLFEMGQVDHKIKTKKDKMVLRDLEGVKTFLHKNSRPLKMKHFIMDVKSIKIHQVKEVMSF